MKKDNYIFPAVLTYEDDGITITFPDLEGCITCAYDTEEVFRNAKEALGLHLYGLETDEEIEGKNLIPFPSEIKDIKLEKNQSVILVEAYMPLFRYTLDSKAVKKTITIPNWMNTLAMKNNINFSQLLQESIKNILKLDVKE